ncbi:MAG: hypothetical protein M0R70_10510 [Nitrospirae bacterium]|nr:hypothetical protein [Nitrospirota bacterium]
MRRKHLLFLWVVIFLLINSVCYGYAENYFVNNEGGADNNSGTSWNDAFESLAPVFGIAMQVPPGGPSPNIYIKATETPYRRKNNIFLVLGGLNFFFDATGSTENPAERGKKRAKLYGSQQIPVGGWNLISGSSPEKLYSAQYSDTSTANVDIIALYIDGITPQKIERVNTITNDNQYVYDPTTQIITYRNDTIDPSSLPIECVSGQTTGIEGCTHMSLYGANLRYFYHGYEHGNCGIVEIADIDVGYSGDTGVIIGGGLAENGIWRNISSHHSGRDGFHILGVNGNKVFNSVSYANAGDGFVLTPWADRYSLSFTAGDHCDYEPSTVFVMNNTSSNNHGVGFRIFSSVKYNSVLADENCTNWNLVNNISSNNLSGEFYLENSVISVVSNSIHNNGWNGYSNQLFLDQSGGGNLENIDPMFVAPDSGDFHLMCSSPYIDKGVSTGLVIDDLDGQLRDNPPDIGADEYDISCCNDNNACTIDTCNTATGCVYTPIVCNDNNACTIDTCNPSVGCVYTPIVCNDNNACTDDFCDPQTGACIHTNNMAVCNDNKLCTENDICSNGVCKGKAKNCNDNNICTSDFCNATTGACIHMNNTALCTDNNACTLSDRCAGGVCVPGTSKNCNDNNICTTDTCDTATGACLNTLISPTCGLPGISLPAGTLLGIDQGTGSGLNTPCETGSCFGMELSPGSIYWTDFGPGTDGGFVVGKAQASGGQEISNIATDGELTNAWGGAGGYATFFTSSSGTLNIFNSTSCTGADCIYKTELKVFNEAWNGSIIPFGSAAGCTLPSCTWDQINGIFVNDYQIDQSDPVHKTWSMSYSQVLPAGPMAGVNFTFIFRGTVVELCDDAVVRCDDSNICTNDSCDPETGACVYVSVADGTDCTEVPNGTCQSGNCVSIDLEPTAMNATKYSATTVRVSETVNNQGSSGTGSFTIRYYLSTDRTYGSGDIALASASNGTGTCSRTVSSLSAGSSSSTSNKTCYKPSGAVTGESYYVLVVDDADSTINEYNETNNVKATSGTLSW